jgi:hypothetical protein
MATMRAVEVRAPGAPLKLVERQIPEPGLEKFGSKYRPAAYATATATPKTSSFSSNTPGFPVTR